MFGSDKVDEIFGRNDLCFSMRIGIGKGFGDSCLCVRVPFKFEGSQLSVFFFDIVNFLLFFGAPEIAIIPTFAVFQELHPFEN